MNDECAKCGAEPPSPESVCQLVDCPYYLGGRTPLHYPDIGRRVLAEKILLKLIEISPSMGFITGDSVKDGEGVRVAWSIADAFLKAEPQE